jgi:hypothetical protein
MTGLVWRDILLLSCLQHCTLAFVSACALWAAHVNLPPRRQAVMIGLLFAALLSAFWSVKIGIDVSTSWISLSHLQRDTWFREFGFRNYLKLQPPLWVGWLVVCRQYPLQQLYALCCGGLILASVWRVCGTRTMYYILAMPLFQLMIIQPSNDLAACTCLCIAAVWRLCWWWSGLWLLLAALLKYSAYPLILACAPVMPRATLLAGTSIAIYWTALLTGINAPWPHDQWRFLLSVYTCGVVSYHVYAPRSFTKINTDMPVWAQHVEWTARKFFWRIRTLTRRALLPSVWYLFPALFRFSRPVWIIYGALLIGFGNIKYLLLVLPVWLAYHRIPGQDTGPPIRLNRQVRLSR